jgi:hypothetical protein
VLIEPPLTRLLAALGYFGTRVLLRLANHDPSIQTLGMKDGLGAVIVQHRIALEYTDLSQSR